MAKTKKDQGTILVPLRPTIQFNISGVKWRLEQEKAHSMGDLHFYTPNKYKLIDRLTDKKTTVSQFGQHNRFPTMDSVNLDQIVPVRQTRRMDGCTQFEIDWKGVALCRQLAVSVKAGLVSQQGARRSYEQLEQVSFFATNNHTFLDLSGRSTFLLDRVIDELNQWLRGSRYLYRTSHPQLQPYSDSDMGATIDEIIALTLSVLADDTALDPFEQQAQSLVNDLLEQEEDSCRSPSLQAEFEATYKRLQAQQQKGKGPDA
jgi:hypothetical protein